MQRAVNYGPKGQNTTCPHCLANVKTTTKYVYTTRTHVTAVLLFLFLCWPCVCVPYCCQCCNNVDHYCPNCKQFLGTYSTS